MIFMSLKMQEELEQAVKVLSRSVMPQKIYLFGSHAKSSANGESDIDLCIITETMGKRKNDIIREARKAISSVLETPMDLLVYDLDEFSELARLNTTFEHKILQEGILLYEQ
ncbi:MAG: nucleotidyltransferase domain-containing protein [Firmicutes bacterium]|nr:nucleotidyltransferase domain-containing protein [Bacillota bacterium]